MATSGMLVSFSVFGYQLATHAAITYSAMLRSTVVGQGVLLGLGVSPSSSTPIALEYFDRMGTDIRRRAAYNFDYDLYGNFDRYCNHFFNPSTMPPCATPSLAWDPISSRLSKISVESSHYKKTK